MFRQLQGIALATALFYSPALALDFAKQGWTQAQREVWYWESQGSRLMPEKWFKALERAGSTSRFSDPAYLSSFGYLPASTGERQYPVGFAVDKQPDRQFTVTKLNWYASQGHGGNSEPWIGLNCSACHTSQIRYKDNILRIDGGPSLTDFQSFIEALDNALNETFSDDGKWNRFAKAVLGSNDNRSNRQLLRSSFRSLLDWQQETARLNATSLRYGFGRIDAFGHIYNKVTMFAGSSGSVHNPSDAPVSVPHLWNIQRQRYVQWNGIAENSKITLRNATLNYGAMGRNAGEVLGVFGEAVINPSAGVTPIFTSYPSSIKVTNQDILESLVEKLKPPAWPSFFPAIDTQLAARGATLFERDCASCHLSTEKLNNTETLHRLNSMQPRDRTDIWMACNALAATMPAGKLNRGDPTQSLALHDALSTTVQGALRGKISELLHIALTKIFGGDRALLTTSWSSPVTKKLSTENLSPKEQRRQFCNDTSNPLYRYKARPLDGIWATAPYLHNGSVPTLYDLLLPATQRPRSFSVGQREYDPKRVGFVAQQTGAGAFNFVTSDAAGAPIDGNSNAGHEYGADKLSEQDRWALVEYMKSL